MPLDTDTTRPIGVFDSGLGGLTVLKALRSVMPQEDYLYIGDTARLPYGSKSPALVTEYTGRAVTALLDRGCKLVVIACNTASAAALPSIRSAWPDLPVIGVIEPGARAAVAASAGRRFGVIGTAGTIRSQAYDAAIRQLAPDADVRSIACALFVALAEEGWMDGPVVEGTARRYLEPLFSGREDDPDCLILGCTHFPPLEKAIGGCLPEGVRIVNPAEATAAEAFERLRREGLARTGEKAGRSVFYVTDALEHFARVAESFLEEPLTRADVRPLSL